MIVLQLSTMMKLSVPSEVLTQVPISGVPPLSLGPRSRTQVHEQDAGGDPQLSVNSSEALRALDGLDQLLAQLLVALVGREVDAVETEEIK